MTLPPCLTICLGSLFSLKTDKVPFFSQAQAKRALTSAATEGFESGPALRASAVFQVRPGEWKLPERCRSRTRRPSRFARAKACAGLGSQERQVPRVGRTAGRGSWAV